VTANITVHHCLATTVILTSTDLSPTYLIAVNSGMSYHIWSAFPVWEKR
jgi:hypothetical protein